jgi:origin recognition complex subunit 1
MPRQIQKQHLIYVDILGDGESTRKSTLGELTFVLDSLLASRAMLMEDGFTAARKPVGERKALLNLEQAEVERVLGDVGGPLWRNALNN